MIRRHDDFSGISNMDLEKISKKIKDQTNKVVFNTFSNINDAKIASSELKLKGYNSYIEKNSSEYKVFLIKEAHIDFEEAEKSGQFKKLAWGRYCFQKESALGMFNYNFDDGSIWKVSKDENGNLVLIKEVENESDEEVIRNKDSKMKKTSSSKKLRYITEDNLDLITKIVYDVYLNEEMKKDIISSNSSSLFNVLNEKFSSLVDNEIEKFNIIEDDKDELRELIASTLGREIDSKKSLNNFVCSFDFYKKSKTNNIKKMFT